VEDALDATEHLLAHLRSQVGYSVSVFPPSKEILHEKVWSGGVLTPNVNFCSSDNDRESSPGRSRARRATSFAGQLNPIWPTSP